eukprot:6998369-Prymnesium_polylepis.1
MAARFYDQQLRDGAKAKQKRNMSFKCFVAQLATGEGKSIVIVSAPRLEPLFVWRPVCLGQHAVGSFAPILHH